MRRQRHVISILVAAAVLTACQNDPDDASPTGGDNTRTAAPAADSGNARDPLDNPDGTEPGLAPPGSSDLARARTLIDRVQTKGRGAKTGYDRDEYGPAWTDNVTDVPYGKNGCGTRDDVLERDGRSIKWKDAKGCVVNSMTLADPYSGKTLEFTKAKASAIQIDHVVPLSASWQMGAARWTADKRRRFANDPLNLLAVDGPTNSGKSDSTPAGWLPPNTQVRCAYAVRYAQVSIKYELPVTDADKRIMLTQCGG